MARFFEIKKNQIDGARQYTDSVVLKHSRGEKGEINWVPFSTIHFDSRVKSIYITNFARKN